MKITPDLYSAKDLVEYANLLTYREELASDMLHLREELNSVDGTIYKMIEELPELAPLSLDSISAYLKSKNISI